MTLQDSREDPTRAETDNTSPSSQHKNVRSKSVSYADDVGRKRELTRTLSEPQPMTICPPEPINRETSSARRKSTDTIGLHYYPEGGWGYVVCFGAFVINFVVCGFIGSFGCFYVVMTTEFGNQYQMQAACVLGTYLGTFHVICPLIVGLCRRKKIRSVAFVGGLILTLSLLFTSFASQFHQLYVSVGILLPIGSSMSYIASSFILGQYFKRRRELVEVITHLGSGLGIAFLSIFYSFVFRLLGWRLGLQILCGVSTTTFIVSAVYRSASLYHPQRRAILHLKSLQKRSKQFRDKALHRSQDKPSLFDIQSMKTRCVQALMLSSSLASFGVHSPLVFLAIDLYKMNVEDYRRTLVLAFVGLAYILGSCAFGFFVHHRTTDCLISRTYLSIISLLVMGFVVLSYRTALNDYHGKMAFAWIYGVFFGGYCYSMKMAMLEKIRHRMFDRGLSIVYLSSSLPCYLGVPLGVYLNIYHQHSGYILSATSLLSAMAVLLIAQVTDKSSKKFSNTHSITSGYCRRCSDISNSVYGPNSCKSSSSTQQTSGASVQISNSGGDAKLQQTKVEVKKTELTCISEEAYLDNISDAYQYYGDCITSCGNAERYLGLSEYENNWNQTCQNIVMDHEQKMIRVRKKSVAVNNEKTFEMCSDCLKPKPCFSNGRILTTGQCDQAISEEEHDTSDIDET